jgi:hypothetical protein
MAFLSKNAVTLDMTSLSKHMTPYFNSANSFLVRALSPNIVSLKRMSEVLCRGLTLWHRKAPVNLLSRSTGRYATSSEGSTSTFKNSLRLIMCRPSEARASGLTNSKKCRVLGAVSPKRLLITKRKTSWCRRMANSTRLCTKVWDSEQIYGRLETSYLKSKLSDYQKRSEDMAGVSLARISWRCIARELTIVLAFHWSSAIG